MAPRTPLVDPGEYFERHDRPSLAVGTGIVLVQTLAFIVALWLFVREVMAHIGLSLAGSGSAQSSVNDQLVVYFFASVLGWLLIAAVLHVFMWFADGDRGFGTTLAVVGEAELVGLVLFPLAAYVLFASVGQIPTDPQQAMVFIQDRAGFQTPLLLLSGLVGTLWKAFITGYGLSIAHDVASEKAFALTFVVGILGYLITLA